MLQPNPETNGIVPHAPPPPQAATIPVKPAAPQSPAQPVAGPGQAKPAIIIPAAEAAVAIPSLAPLLSELPEALRRQIPAMAITGAVNSDNPAQRLLLVNGQVLNQGSQVAPDLTVVEIRSGFSEFNFRGSHFRMAH
jgi:general secretion pathway protein B